MSHTATIEQLKPGSEYPGGNINSRKTYTDKQIKDRLESILMFGVLQSLAVCPVPGATEPPYYVAAGGLRRAAVALGVKTKKLPADFPVPILVKPEWDSAMALAASLEENEQVLAPHPVDNYEQFVELQARGKTVADIGKLFRMETKEVRKVLALGALSPLIRQAWRDEKLDADDAKAFTLAKDQKHQEDVFNRLNRGGGLYAYNIRTALVGNQSDAGKFLVLVGKDAYEAAGGALQADLFTGDSAEKFIVSDFALLMRLAGEKIEQKCKDLVSAGWAWACYQDDLKDFYSLNRMPNAGVNMAKEQKAKAGCAVAVGYSGKLDITYGLLKNNERVGTATSSKTGKEASPVAKATLSYSLRQDLTAMAARATKDALVADTYGDELAILLARIVAAQITPERYNYMANEVREKLSAIRNGIAPKLMAEALQKRFDRQRYFANAPKNLVLKAITDGVGPDHAKKLAAGTKAAAWKFALANVPKTWLPPELRTSHYDGPGAGKVVKIPKKPAKSAAPKKKAA